MYYCVGDVIMPARSNIIFFTFFARWSSTVLGFVHTQSNTGIAIYEYLCKLTEQQMIIHSNVIKRLKHWENRSRGGRVNTSPTQS
jgi:hypothetical protein